MTPTTPVDHRSDWPRVLGGIGLWCVGWLLVPGLGSPIPWEALSADRTTRLLIECAAAVVAIATTLVVVRRRARTILGLDKPRPWLWAIPVALGASVPWHYHLTDGYAPYVYVGWMTVSVVWQQLITFGLLYPHLERYASTRLALVLTPLVFWAGHAVLLPQFRPLTPGGLAGTAFILAIGFAFAFLRRRTGDIRWNLIGHLAFYFIAV